MKQERYSTQEEMDAWKEGLLWGAISVWLVEALVMAGFIVGWLLK